MKQVQFFREYNLQTLQDAVNAFLNSGYTVTDVQYQMSRDGDGYPAEVHSVMIVFEVTSKGYARFHEFDD